MCASKLRASTLEAVGNTPLVRLGKTVPQGSAQVLIKLEYFNPTSSHKDRMALSVIEEAEKASQYWLMRIVSKLLEKHAGTHYKIVRLLPNLLSSS
jgi:cysteine synthase